VALVLLTVVGAPLTAPAAGTGEAPPSEEWTPLFNGRDLSGWTPKIVGHALGDNYADTFRVEDGLLKVSYDGYTEFGNRFGHLFYGEVLDNYRLRVEYRFVGEQLPDAPPWALRNSGLMLHGQPPDTMALDQWFPVSIEAQLLGSDSTHTRPTANLCTPGTHVVMNGELVTRHCTDSRSKPYPGELWVTVEVEVTDAHIQHIVAGETVLEYSDPQLDDTDPDALRLLAAGVARHLHRGSLSLQSEGHPVEFRRIELQRLAPTGRESGRSR
jgi:3-keto-disaccharide hydrolase